MSQIPPYQDIDIAIGIHKQASASPIAGYAITHPVLGAEMFESESEADRRISEIACSGVKYANHTAKFKAWLHTAGNRKYWTPR